MFEIIKVSAKTMPKLAAGAIAGAVRKSGLAKVQAVGASAINQAVKAIAIAAKFIEQDAEKAELVCRPAFLNTMIGDKEKTAMEFSVYAIRME